MSLGVALAGDLSVRVRLVVIVRLTAACVDVVVGCLWRQLFRFWGSGKFGVSALVVSVCAYKWN